MKLIRKILACILLALVSTGQVVSAHSLAELTGTTEQVSVALDGGWTDGVSQEASMSPDGRYVAFTSFASNLVSGDTNGYDDIFVRDRQTGSTDLVSVASDGTQANNYSSYPSISADGRYVAFVSFASNLVSGDTNGIFDVFVHDRQTGLTERVSISSNGDQANGYSDLPSISADGRFVAFQSAANNLVRRDTNRGWDIFVRDRLRGTTKLVSIASDGTQGRGRSKNPSISADGRFVAFQSGSNNLVNGDTNNGVDVFVHDRQTGTTERVSVATDGTQGNKGPSFSWGISISADGRFVAFQSESTNLVSGDTNNAKDIFVHDRLNGITELVSIASDGTQANENSAFPSLSADGRYIAFQSNATNFVSGDTNRLPDIYLHDRQTGTTERVSISSSGDQWYKFPGIYLSVSADGRYVAFDCGGNVWLRVRFGEPSE